MSVSHFGYLTEFTSAAARASKVIWGNSFIFYLFIFLVGRVTVL